MLCQNRVRMGVMLDVPCEHEAIDEASNGLPVCSCCMMLGPLWEELQQEVQGVIEAAAARGQHEGHLHIGWTRDRRHVVVQEMPIPQNDN